MKTFKQHVSEAKRGKRKMFTSKEEILFWAHRYCMADGDTVTVNDDLTVDVAGDFDVGFADDVPGKKNYLPVNFGRIDGRFSVAGLDLASLEGCPKYVEDDFICSDNNLLQKIDYFPEHVGGDIDFSRCSLESLSNLPDVVHGNLFLAWNRLESLEGCPREVGGDFTCSRNNITSLKGGPREVGGSYKCNDNRLMRLDGIARNISGDIYCFNNTTQWTGRNVKSYLPPGTKYRTFMWLNKFGGYRAQR